MVCIYCGSKTQVVNSRLQRRANKVWRRRHCDACGATYSSLEQVDYQSTIMVRCSESHIVPFSRDQLFLSVYDACRHRKSAITDASALTHTVLAMLLPSMQANAGLLLRNQIVEATAVVLKRFDSAAHVHYTAFHPLQ